MAKDLSGAERVLGTPVEANMSSKSLLEGIKRIAAENPETRKHLVPLIAKYACGCGDDMDDMLLLDDGDDGMFAGRTWGNPDPKSTPDDSVPYHKHPDSPDAGADGSPQRKTYNNWFRENVCPGHKTTCGNPALKKKK